MTRLLLILVIGRWQSRSRHGSRCVYFLASTRNPLDLKFRLVQGILLFNLTKSQKYECFYRLLSMALRRPITKIAGRASSVAKLAPIASTSSRISQSPWSNTPQNSMATVVRPVTQDATSSKGPTAMVFMNMGGPSTTDEVGTFLSRLFVCFKTFIRSDSQD